MQRLRVTCDLCRWGLQFYLGSSSSNSILFCSKSSWFILKILIKCHFSRSAHLSGSRKTPRWHEVRLLIGSRGKKSGAIKLAHPPVYIWPSTICGSGDELWYKQTGWPRRKWTQLCEWNEHSIYRWAVSWGGWVPGQLSAGLLFYPNWPAMIFTKKS